jgi:hypothetical protein
MQAYFHEWISKLLRFKSPQAAQQTTRGFFFVYYHPRKKGGIELEQAAQQTGFVCFCIVVTSSKYTERRLKAAS